jgi:hypothetical protein
MCARFAMPFATAPAAWRYSPQSAAGRVGNNYGTGYSRKGFGAFCPSLGGRKRPPLIEEILMAPIRAADLYAARRRDGRSGEALPGAWLPGTA